jgi:Periplasmic protein involved in polysaccharide export
MSVSGPAATDILAGQRDPMSLNYAVVKLTPKIVEVLSKNLPRLSTFVGNQRPRDITFGVGDVLTVTIFEAASGGLFIPAEGAVRPGNFVAIPNQAVDIHGNISVPYAGSIRARGRTQVEVQDAIVTALKNRAIEPQVIVSMVEQKTSMISVLGEGRAARIPATASPERMLDVISRAGLVAVGGSTGAAGAETWVILERSGKRAIAPFGALIYEPVNNVYVHPNDTIYLYRDRRPSWRSGPLARRHRCHSAPGGCRWRRRSATGGLWIARLIRPLYSSIAVKRGRLRKPWASTFRPTKARSFR